MNDNDVQQRKPMQKDVLEYQLGVMSQKEVKIYMDNKPVTLDEALNRCVEERSVYMPDYVLDENGVLEQVRFDRIDV